jgi:DUF4097 and DUF4098 domain-containing protein YvlB
MKTEFVHRKEKYLMLSRLLIQYIAAMSFALVMLTACGGGNDVNFNFEGWGENWPWPWSNNADFFVNKTFSQNVALAGQLNLRLDGMNGEIEIIGEPGGDSVMVTAEARVGSDTFMDAQEGLDQLEVTVTDGNDEISVQTEQPNNTEGRQYIVDYTITVPSDLAVNVSLVNGHVTIQDIDNSISVILDNGNVDFLDIYGNAVVSVVNGNVIGKLIFFPAGEAMISTVNGDIELSIPTVTSAELFGLVDNGIISWDNLNLEDIQSTNKSLQGTLGTGSGLIDLKTVNGNIDILGFNI